MRRLRQHRGFTLVQALVVTAGLMALMAALAAEQRISLNAIQNQLRQRRAETAARSGLAVAMATLDQANIHLATLADDWAILGDNGTQVFDIGDGEAKYRLQILDAGSFINVNTITETQLQSLPVTQEQIDSLLDWRDDSTQGRPQGAKDDYYHGLTEPYNTRLGKLTTLSELLLIKGWTARSLYYPQTDTVSTLPAPTDLNGNPLPLINMLTVTSGMPNTMADGSARSNIARGTINESALASMGISDAIAEQIVRGGPYSNWSDLMLIPGLTPDNAGRLLDAFTMTPGDRLEGKININTVSEAVLESLFALSPDIASSIVSRQSTGFASLGELASVPGLTPLQLSQIADYVGVGSDTWVVRVYGESGGIGVPMEVIVGRRSDRLRVLSFDRLNGSQVPEWWNWADAVDDSGNVTSPAPTPAPARATP